MNSLAKKICLIVAFILITIFAVIMLNEVRLCKYYNAGNELFEEGNYQEARIKYDKALHCFPDEKRECKIRINMALCIVEPIDVENIDESNVDQIIETLEDAKSILMKKGCADDQGTGHSKEAQKLKDDIDKFIQQLKQKGQSGNSQKNKKDNNQKDDDNQKDDQQEKTFKDLQKEAAKERDKEDRMWENSSDFDSLFDYDGDCW